MSSITILPFLGPVPGSSATTRLPDFFHPEDDFRPIRGLFGGFWIMVQNNRYFMKEIIQMFALS